MRHVPRVPSKICPHPRSQIPWTVHHAWTVPIQRKKVPGLPSEDEEPENVPSVSIPGFDRILSKKTHKAWKIAWILVLLLNLALCIFHLSGLVKRYLYDSITMNSGINEHRKVDFPAITLCPAEDLLTNPRVIEYLQETLKNPSLSDQDIWKQNTNISVEEVWKAAAFDRPIKYFLACGFKQDCTYKVSFKRSKTHKGLCFLYSFRESIPYTGRFTFFHMKVDVDNNTLEEPFHYSYHNKTNSNRHTFYHKNEGVLRGSYRNISFYVREDMYINFASNPCTEDPNADDCLNKCFDRILSYDVKCTLPHMNIPRLPPCQTPASIHETHTKMMEVYKKTKVNSCPCIRKCHAVSISNINTNLKVQDPFLLQMSFRFEYSWREFMQEIYVYNTVAFLSDLGGSMGLFLGFSILSIIEVFEWFITPNKPTPKSMKVKDISTLKNNHP